MRAPAFRYLACVDEVEIRGLANFPQHRGVTSPCKASISSLHTMNRALVGTSGCGKSTLLRSPPELEP